MGICLKPQTGEMIVQLYSFGTQTYFFSSAYTIWNIYFQPNNLINVKFKFPAPHACAVTGKTIAPFVQFSLAKVSCSTCMCIYSNLIAPVVQFLLATVYKFCIAKPRLQGWAWALEISSQALDKGLSRAWAWLGLGFSGLGLAGLRLSGLAHPSLIVGSFISFSPST